MAQHDRGDLALDVAASAGSFAPAPGGAVAAPILE